MDRKEGALVPGGLLINTTRLTGGLLSGYKPLLPASA